MVAFVASLNAPPKLLVDWVPVGIVGSECLNTLAVTPVLFAAERILLLRTPLRRMFCALLDVCFLHLLLFLSTWLRGRGSMNWMWRCIWVVTADDVLMLLWCCCGKDGFEV